VPGNPVFDVVIAGGGIGGVICLKYAKDAGLKAVLLEARERVGGIWRDLPSWQDIQIRKEDWTLGDLPLAGEDQASILRNIESWVERFGLAPDIRLNARVREARPQDGGWRVRTDQDELRARYLIAATGGHNRPVVPAVEREGSTIAEFHSSALRDPQLLAGKRVAVVGGGASAYDLLELCFVHGASRVLWIYRSTKWMRPTRQAKYFGTDMRLLARYQMLGLPIDAINRLATRDLEARYARAGIGSIKPEGGFDLRRDQFIPGRRRMIQNFARIERHRGEVRSLGGTTARLSDGAQVDIDVLLWGTGYAPDLDYLGIAAISGAKLPEISARCRSVFLSTDAPNLFLLAPGVLETSTSTPWAYAHVAKSIMAHIAGRPVFVEPPRAEHTNHCDLVKLFAAHDRRSYPPLLWYLRYLWLALRPPRSRPMPIP
jgi:hypothetical protein